MSQKVRQLQEQLEAVPRENPVLTPANMYVCIRYFYELAHKYLIPKRNCKYIIFKLTVEYTPDLPLD